MAALNTRSTENNMSGFLIQGRIVNSVSRQKIHWPMLNRQGRFLFKAITIQE